MFLETQRTTMWAYHFSSSDSYFNVAMGVKVFVLKLNVFINKLRLNNPFFDFLVPAIFAYASGCLRFVITAIIMVAYLLIS